MTSKKLQELLKKLPDDLLIWFYNRDETGGPSFRQVNIVERMKYNEDTDSIVLADTLEGPQ